MGVYLRIKRNERESQNETSQSEKDNMSKHEVHVSFAGKIVFVGFGSIGQGVLPWILRHIRTSSDRITIVTAENSGRTEPDQFGYKLVKTPLTRHTHRSAHHPLHQPPALPSTIPH